MAEVGEKGCVVVTGASGFIGSWLVKRLLHSGYSVRATFRDPTNESKTNPLLSLAENRDGRLTLWKADLCDEGSFDAAVYGSVAVFHTATVMDINTKDPENEVIKPTVKGVLNVMRSCKKADTVKRVVFTSSAAALSVKPDRPAVIDESSWSDVDFINRVKMNGWMYFLSKVLAERAAFDYARENGIHLISVVPPLVIGPFCTNTLPPSMRIALSPITGHTSFYNILNPTQLVHVDDLCGAEIFLLEHLEAEGRYVCSSHHLTIYELADTIRNHLPEYGGKIPTKYKHHDLN